MLQVVSRAVEPAHYDDLPMEGLLEDDMTWYFAIQEYHKTLARNARPEGSGSEVLSRLLKIGLTNTPPQRLNWTWQYCRRFSTVLASRLWSLIERKGEQVVLHDSPDLAWKANGDIDRSS